MNGELTLLISKIRDIANKDGIEAITISKLRRIPDIAAQLKKNKITSDNTLVEYVLENERKVFEDIFVDNNFEENEDAIDILFKVSQEIQ